MLALVLAAAYGLAAQPYDFSHRTHLTMRLECVRCHPAVPKSIRPPAAEEATFSSDACLDCHSKAILNLRPALPPPIAHFSHAVHLTLKDETCASCHHGLIESGKVTEALFPKMAECMACHKPAAAPEGCYLCHAKDDVRVRVR